MRGKQKKYRFQLRNIRREVWAGLIILLQFFLLELYIILSPKVNLYRLRNYTKKFDSEEVNLCGTSSGKTYEDYRMITDPASNQYRLIHRSLKVDPKTGFLYDKDGFIAAALGYQFGEIGSRYYFTLDTGIVLPLIKADAKAPVDASDGCQVDINRTVIEFVIDSEASERYFGKGPNGYILNGNFNNDMRLAGNIVKMEKVKQ